MTLSNYFSIVIYLKVYQTVKTEVLTFIFLERYRLYVYKHFESCEMVIVNLFLFTCLDFNSYFGVKNTVVLKA